ncbi:hypothetical protein BKA80DRAFT_267353 [Phyllosticta citrichinensis]
MPNRSQASRQRSVVLSRLLTFCLTADPPNMDMPLVRFIRTSKDVEGLDGSEDGPGRGTRPSSTTLSRLCEWLPSYRTRE